MENTKDPVDETCRDSTAKEAGDSTAKEAGDCPEVVELSGSESDEGEIVEQSKMEPSDTLDLEAVMEQDLMNEPCVVVESSPESPADGIDTRRDSNNAMKDQKIQDLENQLETTEKQLRATTAELDSTVKKLSKAERLYEKVNQYNEDLRKQVRKRV